MVNENKTHLLLTRTQDEVIRIVTPSGNIDIEPIAPVRNKQNRKIGFIAPDNINIIRLDAETLQPKGVKKT